MLFTAPIFLFIFLPLFLLAYYTLSSRVQVRNYIALAASVLFFAWGEPVYVLFLIAGTFIDYCVSLVVAPQARGSVRTKKLVLTGAIVLNVAALVFSKYLDFIVTQILQPLEHLHHWHVEPPHFPLLLGISFITFHRISYLVDSFKGRAVPPRGFLDCALYIFLFPQLIAGPIIRYHDIGRQIQAREHTVEGFLTGFNRFAVGLAKKLLFADPLGILADRIFGFPAAELSPLYAWGGIVAYTLQLYFDFSGYSDMAIGLGRMMGFRFPENFNRPYTALSVTDFWRRWHISLSSWMKQYLYIPLGGNRASPARTYLNLWIVFVVSGIWHGANWTFLAWGAYYGTFLCIERALANSRLSALVPPAPLRWLATILIVMVSWVLFRAPTIEHAWHYIGAMFGAGTAVADKLQPWGLVFGNRELVMMALGAVLACVRIPRLEGRWTAAFRAAWSDTMTIQGNAALSVQFLVTLMLTLVSAAAIASAEYVPFLYFRF
jgi:alginate O-acetyltransferase complex protein AlgI